MARLLNSIVFFVALHLCNNDNNNNPSVVAQPSDENEQDASLHPDIVMVMEVEGVDKPRRNWYSSYSVGNTCYCKSGTSDNGIGDVLVDTKTSLRILSIDDLCDLIGKGPGSKENPSYNDIQCGNGPASNDDELACPGRVDIGSEGCGQIGPKWNLRKVIRQIENNSRIEDNNNNNRTNNNNSSENDENNVTSPAPSDAPSSLPSDLPSSPPSDMPSDMLSDEPSNMPSDEPSDFISDQPSMTQQPSDVPSDAPTLEDDFDDQESTTTSSYTTAINESDPDHVAEILSNEADEGLPSGTNGRQRSVLVQRYCSMLLGMVLVLHSA